MIKHKGKNSNKALEQMTKVYYENKPEESAIDQDIFEEKINKSEQKLNKIFLTNLITKKISHYVCTKNGGYGAFRELADLILTVVEKK